MNLTWAQHKKANPKLLFLVRCFLLCLLRRDDNRTIVEFKEHSNSAADSEDEVVEATLTGLPLDAKELIMTKLPIGKLQMMNMVNREYKVLSRNVYVKKLKAEQTEVNRVNDHLTAIGIANDWEVAEDQVVAG